MYKSPENDPSLNMSSLPQDEETFENTELKMVHLRRDEAKSFDLMQNPEGHGMPFIDDEIPIRSYAPLGEKLKNDPEFRQLYINAIQQDESGQESPEMDHFHEIGSSLTKEIPFMPAPGDDMRGIKEMARAGDGGDSLIVLMPQNMIYLLNTQRGGENINKITGLPEFGNVFNKVFKEISRPFKSNPVREVVRVATTVAGAVMGGPLGAAGGSALGSALTGRKPQDWLGQAGKAGALTWGAQMLAPHIPGFGQMGAALGQSGIPGMGALGQTMSNWAAPQAAGAGALMGGMGGAGGNTVSAPGITSYTSQTGQNLMGTLPGAAGGGGGVPGSLGFGGGGGSNFLAMAPMALQGISGLLAHKADKDNYKERMKIEEEFRRREEEKEERSRERLGLNARLNPADYKRRVNPYRNEPGEPYYIYEDDQRSLPGNDRQFKNKGGRTVPIPKIWGKTPKDDIQKQDFVKSGALLKGPGDGVSDSIYTDVPEDTFVVNAYTVSMVGNGDSAAGAKRIQEWLETMEKEYGAQVIEYLKKLTQGKQRVPVAFSSGEVPILPYHVMMLGNLSLEKGHNSLDLFQKNIKKHKSQHRGVLPPPTKNLSFYLKK